MNFDKYLIEEFQILNPEKYRNLLNTLNEEDNWRILLTTLSNFRVPIRFQVEKIRLMESSHSPTKIIFDELIKRTCTIATLKDLLRNSKLLNVLSLISEPEQLEIIKQPGEDDEVLYVCYDDELVLECEAYGLPAPEYQWYHDNIQLDNQTNPLLNIQNFSMENEGDYYCIVSHKINQVPYEIGSHTITVFVMDTLPKIVQQPPLKIVSKVGTDINLVVEIDCKTRYSLQWMFNNAVLPGQTSTTLTLKNLTKANSGKYRCVAKNTSGEVFTLPSSLIVEYVPVRHEPPPAKVALLIANEKYDNFTDLSTPVNDIILLNEKLTQLNFKVITLMNLTRAEMYNTINWFFQLIPAGSYAFICFVGHGFMLTNNKFMMPVDCPGNADYKMADCICDEFLVMKAKENKMRLLVLVLDMCLKVPDSDENVHIFTERAPEYIYEPYGECHVLRTFSTASHQSAYEHPEREYGIYLPHICKYLTRNQGILDNFLAAHEDFEKKKLIKVQKPSLSVDGSHKIKLTDRACENSEFLAKFEEVNKLKNIHELKFTEIGLKTKMCVEPYKGKILNALDLHFSRILLPWKITVHVSPEVFELRSKVHEDNITLSMFKLQKAMSDVFITVILNNSKNNDSATIDLGLPLFAMAKIWYDPVR